MLQAGRRRMVIMNTSQNISDMFHWGKIREYAGYCVLWTLNENVSDNTCTMWHGIIILKNGTKSNGVERGITRGPTTSPLYWIPFRLPCMWQRGVLWSNMMPPTHHEWPSAKPVKFTDCCIMETFTSPSEHTDTAILMLQTESRLPWLVLTIPTLMGMTPCKIGCSVMLKKGGLTAGRFLWIPTAQRWFRLCTNVRMCGKVNWWWWISDVFHQCNNH